MKIKAGYVNSGGTNKFAIKCGGLLLTAGVKTQFATKKEKEQYRSDFRVLLDTLGDNVTIHPELREELYNE
jgi:hypothetical protein